MMKITVYELIKLIKENKAPKKVWDNETIYTYDRHNQDYYNTSLDKYLIYEINKKGDLWLNKKINIMIEEVDIQEIENEDIEEMFIKKKMKQNYGVDYKLTHQEFFIQEKINELVKEVNKLRKEVK